MHRIKLLILFFPLTAILTMTLTQAGCVEGETERIRYAEDTSKQDIAVDTGSETPQEPGDTVDTGEKTEDTLETAITSGDNSDEDTGGGADTESQSATESAVDSESDSVDTDTPRSPSAGEVIVTEIMFNPEDENNGEYFELYNTAEAVISLFGCAVLDNDPDHAVALEDITIDPSGFALIAQSDNTEKNGGLTPDFTFKGSFGLNNSGDAVVLTCGDTLIDIVDYADATFAYLGAKSADGVSLTLSPDFFDAAANDDGANWCLSTSTYGSAGHKGTPAAANDLCENN